jgi:hypothetical protein
MPGTWHTVVVPDAAPKLASNLAGLGTGQYDGHVGIIRLGSYPDIHAEEFVWSSAASKWIGANEYQLVTGNDAWGMDWARQPLARIRNKWCRPNGGVSWQVIGPHGALVSDVTLPQATIQIECPTTYNASNFPPGGYLIRDQLVVSTGASDVSAGVVNLTGCTGGSGTYPGKTGGSSFTPVIPFGQPSGGDQGGWGTTGVMLDRVGEMFAAGFTLQERLDGFINGTTDLTSLELAAFYLNMNAGEDLGASGNYPGLNVTADLVPGLLGPGVKVTGPAYDMGGYSAPGTHKASDERGYERRTSPWTTWAAATPTKRFLWPLLYGRHNVATKSNGEAYSVNLSLRWVSP